MNDEQNKIIDFFSKMTEEEKAAWMEQAQQNWPDTPPSLTDLSPAWLRMIAGDIDDAFLEAELLDDEDYVESDGDCMPLPIYGTVDVRHVAEEPKPVKVDYKGYRRLRLNETEMAEFYNNLQSGDILGQPMLVNEYLIIENEDGKVVDVRKWNGEELITVSPKKVSSLYLGKCAPKDEVQMCAFDSIQENDITVLYGKAGCGKTHIPVSHIMSWLESPKYNKLYVVYSYEPMRNAKTLGFEKGTHTEKVLMSGSIGNILASKLGDMQAVERMIEDNKLEIVPTANIRGMEFNDKSIVLVTEAQNLDVYTMKTIVQRCAEGCKQIYEGDVLEQTDVVLANSGMARLIEIFKGHPNFGCIKLHKGYRSPLCELADRM